MEVLDTCRKATKKYSLPYRTRARPFSRPDPIKKTKTETSVPMQQQHMIRDPYSTSETHNQKPLWYLLLSRTGQAAAMRKINAVYKQSPGLAWEEKWVVAQDALKKSRAEEMAGIDEAILHMKRGGVIPSDEPLPDIFANCSTEQERCDALFARPSPSAQLALDNFYKRTVSGNSMKSTCDTEEATVEVGDSSKAKAEDTKRVPRTTDDPQVMYHISKEKEDERMYEEKDECMCEEDDECMSEDDSIDSIIFICS